MSEVKYRTDNDEVFDTLTEALEEIGWTERSSDGLWIDPDGEGPYPIIEAMEEAEIEEVRVFKKRIVMAQSVVLDVEVVTTNDEEATALLIQRAKAGNYDKDADEAAYQMDGWEMTHFEDGED